MDTAGIRDIFQTLLKNWAMKQLTPANVQAVLTAGLAQLRTVTDETENKIDDYVLDFLESIVLNPTKIETLTEFIRFKISSGLCETNPKDKEILARSLTLATEPCEPDAARFLSVLRAAKRFIEVVVPVIEDFFNEKR